MTQSSGNRREAAIAFIMVTLFIDILGLGIIIPVLPKLVLQLLDPEIAAAAEASGAAFTSDLSQVDPEFKDAFSRAGRYVGVIGASYALMQFLFAPVLGALSDRFGRRPVLLISLFGLGVDFLIQGFAPNIWWLFGGRILAGIMGANFTTANAYIADISDDSTRARNFGFVGMMFGLGFTIGPALGGFLGMIDLRLPFFVAAGLALVNWLYGFFVLPESLAPDKRSSFTLSNVHPLGAFGRLKAYPLVAGLAVVFACKSLAQRGLENVWVLHTSYRYGWDEFTNGLALGLVGVTAIVVQGGLVRPVIGRIGERRAVILGSIIGAIAFVGYGLASQGWMVPYIIIFGALGGVAGPAIQSLVTRTVDETEQGKIQGTLTSLTSLTNIAAPLFFNTFLFSYFISNRAPIHLPGAPFLVGAMLLTLSIFIAIRVFRRFPSEVESSQAVAEDSASNTENSDAAFEDPDAASGSPADE